MWIYFVINMYKRNFGFTILINHERADLNYAWTYFSLTLYLGCSSFSAGKEIICWNRMLKLRTKGWNIHQVTTKGE